MPKPLSVVIVEDQRDVREGLALLIGSAEGFSSVRSCRTMEEALRGLDEERPDVVLTDLGLPGMSGIEGIGRIRARFATLPILALTVHDSDDHVFAALCAPGSPLRGRGARRVCRVAVGAGSRVSTNLDNARPRLEAHGRMAREELVACTLGPRRRP